MPQKIIIVRHGETKDNVERRLQGWADTPLNELGILQAQKVAERLAKELIHAVYSSDLVRAHKTAFIIAEELGLQAIKDLSLREHKMGIFEGWQWEKEPDPVREQLWVERTAAIARDIHWKTIGTESLAEFTTRVRKFTRTIEHKHKNDNVLLVAHGGTINRIMEIYGFKKPSEEYFGYLNTSVTILTKTKTSYELLLHNDTSHL
ncbi:MAG: histidine phosphatase family protein [bacterium]